MARMLDMPSYIMGQDAGYAKGKAAGKGVVELEGTDYTFTDDGEGNITITEGNS
ncbi:MAG: hypothetical protein J6Y20_07130 [Lachnospiraceae bacterium]|nr:hypothetical protein [Lachnospiraceae bacterium]